MGCSSSKPAAVAHGDSVVTARPQLVKPAAGSADAAAAHTHTNAHTQAKNDGGSASPGAVVVLTPPIGPETASSHAAAGGYVVTVAVIQARGLRAADVRRGSSDPYVCVCVPGATGSEVKRTKRRTRALNPVFNDRLGFVCKARPASISFKVFDYDAMSKDDLLAECMHTVAPPVETSASGSAAGAATGIVHAPIQWVPLTYGGQPAGELQIQVVVRPADQRVVAQQAEFVETIGLTTLRVDELAHIHARVLAKALPASLLAEGRYRLRVALTHGVRVFNGRAVNGRKLSALPKLASHERDSTSALPPPADAIPPSEAETTGEDTAVQQAVSASTADVVPSVRGPSHEIQDDEIVFDQDCRVWIRAGEEKYVVKAALYAEYDDARAPSGRRVVFVGQGFINTAVLQDGLPREFHVALRPQKDMTDAEHNKLMDEISASSTAIAAGAVGQAATTVRTSGPTEGGAAQSAPDGSGFKVDALDETPTQSPRVQDAEPTTASRRFARQRSPHVGLLLAGTKPSAVNESAAAPAADAGAAASAASIAIVKEEVEDSVGTLVVRAEFQDRDAVETWFFDTILRDFDQDSNGRLSYGEFALLLATLEEHFTSRIPEKEALFRQLDVNRDEMLDREELLRWLTSPEFQSSPMAFSILSFLADGVLGLQSLINDVGSVVRAGTTRTADDAGVVEIVEHGEVVKDVLGLKIFDRYTGLIVDEFIPSYVRAAIKTMYDSSFGSLLTTSLPAALRSLSQMEGRHNDDPESRQKIPAFVKAFQINTDEIARPLSEFPNFNEFFFRELKPDARPIQDRFNPAVLVSPADSRVVVYPTILDATQVWVKGESFSVERLLGAENTDIAPHFLGGSLAIFRLAPQDYHRWHMPLSGRIIRRTKIDGALYTVNPMAIRRRRPDVFTSNKREVAVVQSRAFGLACLVSVGATCVGSINIVPTDDRPYLRKGDCHGYFAFGGSTVLLLLQPNAVNFDTDLLEHSTKPLEVFVRVGDRVGVAPARDASSGPLHGTLPDEDAGWVEEMAAAAAARAS